MGYPKMDGLQWTILFKRMILEYPGIPIYGGPYWFLTTRNDKLLGNLKIILYDIFQWYFQRYAIQHKKFTRWKRGMHCNATLESRDHVHLGKIWWNPLFLPNLNFWWFLLCVARTKPASVECRITLERIPVGLYNVNGMLRCHDETLEEKALTKCFQGF